jgi:ATP-dependent phosphofructokinase / diphosphate-dependent phosphofructokinase
MIKRIAVNTGGGDAPGLNAVLRAVVLSALRRGWEVFGIRRGYEGLLEGDELIKLDRAAVRGIGHLGGTILGTTNRGNPFDWVGRSPDGSVIRVDRSNEVLEGFQRHRLDALIAVGGDGSLTLAHQLWKRGLPVVGVPKTIDNDLLGTDITFGFQTAVQTASDAIDKLHSTAESHERVMVVEVMGRTAGWIALYSGLSGSADVILIPEIPYSLEKVCQKINERYESGKRFAILVAAEGAAPRDGEAQFVEAASKRLGGIADKLARQIAEATGHETRALVLGHLQRGGSPNAFDRQIALRFGAAAVRAVADEKFGTMIAIDEEGIHAVPLDEVVGRVKLVPIPCDTVDTARELGTSFGD